VVLEPSGRLTGEKTALFGNRIALSVVQPGGQEPYRLRSSGSRTASDQHYGFVELTLILYLIKHQAMQTGFQVRQPRCVEYKLKYIKYSHTQLCIILCYIY